MTVWAHRRTVILDSGDCIPANPPPTVLRIRTFPAPGLDLILSMPPTSIAAARAGRSIWLVVVFLLAFAGHPHRVESARCRQLSRQDADYRGVSPLADAFPDSIELVHHLLRC